MERLLYKFLQTILDHCTRILLLYHLQDNKAKRLNTVEGNIKIFSRWRSQEIPLTQVKDKKKKLSSFNF